MADENEVDVEEPRKWSGFVGRVFVIGVATFMKLFIEPRRMNKVGSYSVFTFEPLHNVHLGIFKLRKECAVSYLAYNRLKTVVVQHR